MPTSNKIVTVSGTGYTVDVSVCNLDADLTLKDFVVLHNGVLVSNTNYTKTTRTILTYTGTALASTTVEVRRRTSTSYVLGARYGSRIRSDDWNKELDRITRRAEEYELNGVGSGSITGSQAPQNDPFGSVWSTDIVYPPTRKAVYDYMVNLVTATGLSTTLAGYVTTANLSTALTPYAPSASPAFTGTPTAPTPITTDNSTKLATTAYVQNVILGLSLSNYAPLANPTFTGIPKAPTAALGTSTTQLATTNFVSTANRPFVDAYRATTTQSCAHNAFTTLVFNTEYTDTNNAYNTTTGEFTVPAGLGGNYDINGFLSFTANATLLVVEAFVNGTVQRRLGQAQSSGDNVAGVSIVGTLRLTAGDIVTLRLYQLNSAAAARDLLIVTPQYCWITIKRISV